MKTISEEEDREKLLVNVSQNTISSLDHLWQITKEKQTVVENLRKMNLFPKEIHCNKCQIKMNIRNYPICLVGYKFYCIKCKQVKSIRTNNFFYNTRTDLTDITCRFLPHLNRKMIIDWYSFCRDVCIKHFIDNPVKFSNGLVKSELQIDESIFGKKRKYHRGKNFKRFWVFGISNPDEHQIHIEIVDSRDRDTLEKIISVGKHRFQTPGCDVW